MKKTIVLMFVLFSGYGIYSQSNSSFSSTHIIAKLNKNIQVQALNNELKFQDENLNSYFTNLGVEKISKLSKGKSNRKIHDEILLLSFNHSIDVLWVINEIASKELFKYLEPDFIGSFDGQCIEKPDDTHFESRQWAMVNDGIFETGSVFDGDIDMDSAWSLTTGDSTVTVSTLDSGLKLDHEDLVGRIWKNQNESAGNATDDDANGYIDDINGWDFINSDNDPTDDNGHGTSVTGIIGANGNNNIGYAGVDWNCKLMTCKVLDDEGLGLYSNWISAINYSIDNGADVINMSLSGASFSQALQDAIDDAYSNNIPVVVSMGNDNSVTSQYPAALNNVIAVGATSSNNERSSPFTWGGGSNWGNHIDLVAPGNKIFGLHYQSNTNYNTYWSGTSQATPYVTGVVALLKGIVPAVSVDSIENLLTQNAVDQIGNVVEDAQGWDPYYGFGLLNAYQTLSKVIDSSAEPSTSYDVQTACVSYTWIDDVVYTESNNTASKIFVNSVGCDSTVFLDLTIKEVNTATAKLDSATVESNAIGATYQWLDCDMAYIPIEGATSRIFSANRNSNFVVVVTENSCSDTSDCVTLKVNLATVSVNSLNTFEQVKIYPTVTDGFVNIALADLKDVTIKVFSTQGQLISKMSHVNESIVRIKPKIATGIYFIEISNSIGKQTFRLVKK